MLKLKSLNLVLLLLLFVKIEITEPGVITAAITKESVEKLGLSEGDDVTAIIKSTEVIIGK